MYFIGIFKFVVYKINMCIKQFWDIVGTISCNQGKIVTKCNIFNNQQENMMNITMISATDIIIIHTIVHTLECCWQNIHFY